MGLRNIRKYNDCKGAPMKLQLFRPLSHERMCACDKCDVVRAENHLTRVFCNFRPVTYPPKFYEGKR